MLLKQYDLGYLAHASYLIADEATGTAVVVDLQRDIAPYLHDTMPHGWHIDLVFLTHCHADFLASHDARDSGEHAGTDIAASLHLPLNQLKRPCSTVPRGRTVQPAALTPWTDYPWYRWEGLRTPPAARAPAGLARQEAGQ